MDTFFQQFINGLSLGAIYALIALGYTMVYGVLRLINYAHGDVYMLGAFAGYFLANALQLPTGSYLLIRMPFIPARVHRFVAPRRSNRPSTPFHGPAILF